MYTRIYQVHEFYCFFTGVVSCITTAAYQRGFFSGIILFSPPVAGLFSRSRPWGTQRARVCASAQVWVPAELRGTCSGRSKSRNLADNRGEAFRPARAKQSHGNPDCHVSFFFNSSESCLPPFLKYRSRPQKARHNNRALNVSLC